MWWTKPLCFLAFISVAFGWHKCTQFTIEQYLCNYTSAHSASNCSSDDNDGNCYYDNAQSKCICKYLAPCPGKSALAIFENLYEIIKLKYLISLQVNDTHGYFLASNLSYDGQNNWFNSSLLPTLLSVLYATNCDGAGDSYSLINGSVSFDTPQNFSASVYCNNDDLSIYYGGPPVFNYFLSGVSLNDYKGAYYMTNTPSHYGAMLTPETKFISHDYFNITGVSFASTPDPPQFEDYCVKYTSRAWYNGSNVLNITYDYLNRILSAAINNQVEGALINGYNSISLNPGYTSANASIVISSTLINYIDDYNIQLTFNNSDYSYFYLNIILYNNNSYINDTNLFTYDDSCSSTEIYNNDNGTYLTNELCCVEWSVIGTASPPPDSITTTSPPDTITTSSPPNPITTTSPPDSITTTHPRSNSCPSSWYTSIISPKNCYTFVNSTTSWFDAQRSCTNLSPTASLVYIDSAFENSEITSQIQQVDLGCDSLYIGLYNNNGNWTWINGDASQYRNWKQGFPTKDSSDVCAIIGVGDGKWENQNCDILQCYICKLVLN